MSIANVAPKLASIWSVSGSGGGSGTSYVWDNKSITAATGTTQIQSKLQVDGDADINGDIRVQGRSISESLAKIEERLNILIPNVRLEKDWKELGQLRMQYVELERKLLEQQRVFDILKKCD